MKKKKFLLGLSIAVLAASALSACGGSSSSKKSSSDVSSSIIESSKDEVSSAEASSQAEATSAEEQSSAAEQSSAVEQSSTEEQSSAESSNSEPGTQEQSSGESSGEIIEGDKCTFGFGDGLTSWTVLSDKAGTKEVTDKNGNVTTVLASSVTYDQFSFASNDKNRIDPVKDESGAVIGYVYVSQAADITIKLKTIQK